MHPTDHYIRVGSIRVRYWMAGERGDPLLLIHGIGRSVEDWADVMSALATCHRVYALDLAGFGRSDRPTANYSFPFFAQFVYDYLNVLGIERTIIVGSSLGGGIAMEVAARWPERVAGLVLVGSAGFGSDVALGLRLMTIPWLGEWLTQPNRTNARRSLETLFHDRSLIIEERIEQEHQLAGLPGAQASLLRVARTLLGPSGRLNAWIAGLPMRLRVFGGPILVVWGDADQVLPVRHCSVALRQLPHAAGHIIGGCGHFPQLERPREFAEIVQRFLSDTGLIAAHESSNTC